MARYNGSSNPDVYANTYNGKWCFFSIVKSGTKIYSYINYLSGSASYKENNDVTTGTVINATNVRIGARNDGVEKYIGSMSDILFENRAWSPSQLKNKYASDLGFF